MDSNVVDQYVLALVGMEHADAEAMPDNSVRGKTWIHKILHGASKISGKDTMFDFKPYTYGAYSQAVADSVERCARKGLLCIHRPDRDGGAVHLTEEGEKARDESACDADLLGEIQTTKSLLNRLDYREMIVYSYTRFPEMAERSDIVADFESWREDAAISTYLKGVVSFALAMRMSGMDREDFETRLHDGGVEPYSPLIASMGRGHDRNTDSAG